MAGKEKRRWRVYCPGLGGPPFCGWRGYRRGETAAQVTAKPCPECGQPFAPEDAFEVNR